jgi:alcohol dehydrogenase class IV
MTLFTTSDKIITGCGSIAELPRVVSALGKKVLFVTGRSGVKKAGISGRVMQSLRSSGTEVSLFDEVEAEPEAATVDRGRDSAGGADVVVGLGGGSALDAAKAIAGLANEDEKTVSYIDGSGAIPRKKGLPFIAVPTTSGSGAEATPNAVISCRQRNIKLSIRADYFLPAVIILDPELTLSNPGSVTAHSGIDAFVQAVESYCSIKATPMTRALSLSAVKCIHSSLIKAFEEGGDIEARTQMAWGSLMAGIALSNARLGLIHGMAHPLAEALRVNRESMGRDYEILSHVVKKDVQEYAGELLRVLRLPADLKGFNVRSSDFEIIIDESMTSGSLKANPRKVTREDLKEILTNLC